MRTARRAALRVLWLMMVGSLILPAALFTYTAWDDYADIRRLADERIGRSLDVLHEHALKVFQAADLVMDEIAEGPGAWTDERLRGEERRVHESFARMAKALPQIQSIWLIDRGGAPLVSSYIFPAPRGGTLADRDYFKAQIAGDPGTYVGAVLRPRFSDAPAFFSLSRRRPAPGGDFNGVITVSLLPADFEKFYRELAQGAGSYFSMIRSDGVFLARYPDPAADGAALPMPGSALAAAIEAQPARGLYTAPGRIDGVERRYGYRKLAGYPIYLLAGFSTAAIREEWREALRGHLLFGLPLTLLVFVAFGLALSRTRRMHREAERREAAERALQQAQRLEAIGQLTGGIAHDFNNLLMIVSGAVDRLKRDMRGDRDRRFLDMIATAAERGESLTRQLLAFARRQALSPQVIDVGRALPRLKEMLARSLREDIEVVIDVPDGVCGVKVDPAEFELAVLNIAVNARDAMPKGGVLRIAVRRVRLDGSGAPDGLHGEFIEVAFTDDGAGIEPGHLPHVFEPFFTTKGETKGTGLGLSQVYGFARQSGGTVSIDSRVGDGTTVRIYLPCTDESPAPQPSGTVGAPLAAAGQTVLLVEDNPQVAEVCAAYLDHLGFASVHLASPPEALRYLQDGKPADIVLSDIVMPQMSGLEFAVQARTLRPDLPIALMTGFSSSADEARRKGFVLLRKPFDAQSLNDALARAMRATARPAPG